MIFETGYVLIAIFIFISPAYDCYHHDQYLSCHLAIQRVAASEMNKPNIVSPFRFFQYKYDQVNKYRLVKRYGGTMYIKKYKSQILKLFFSVCVRLFRFLVLVVVQLKLKVWYICTNLRLSLILVYSQRVKGQEFVLCRI